MRRLDENPDVLKYLNDALTAIVKIERYVANVESLEAYAANDEKPAPLSASLLSLVRH